MRGWLGFGLLALVTACGGATQSDVFGDPPAAPAGSNADPSTNPPPPAPTGTSKPKPGPTPCQTTAYYRDDDNDGFGGSVTQVACSSPGAGWVTKGGDCADNDEDVFPGQPQYFHESYPKATGGRSFDYDCNTKEEQKPPARKAAAPCALVGNACTGDGFIPAPRSGAGVDSLCGATQYQTCMLKLTTPGGACEAKLTTLDPVSCH
jgi:hypothetical protein